MVNLEKFRLANHSVSTTIHVWLLLSSGFSCFLLLIRMIVTNSVEYIFLPWNLFLAFVPFWIATGIAKNTRIIESRVKLFGALAAWLLFIPNSFYIITDFFHFSRFRSVPQWFDLLLIFSFAWNGILYGIISLRRVEIIISEIRGRSFSILLVFAVMWLSAFGIYIGRFLRFNSWDVIADPFSLAREIIVMVSHPLENSFAWGMTLCYSVFMTLIFFTIKKLSESFSISNK